MQYLTIVGKNFEDALAKAYKQYGKDIHVYSRRTLGKARKETEINFYITENKRKGVKNPLEDALVDIKTRTAKKSSQEQDETEMTEKDLLVKHAEDLLALNDFSKRYIQKAIKVVRQSLEKKSINKKNFEAAKRDVELVLVDYIISKLIIDMDTQVSPPKIFTLLGPTGVGKTTTLAKIAALFGWDEEGKVRKSVGIVTLDTFRIGAFEQVEAFAKALGVPCKKASDEKEFYTILEKYKNKDLILVDTLGKSPKDVTLAVRLKTLLSVPKADDMLCYLVVSASMKSSDISAALEHFSSYNIKSLIVTKIDETETIGNILSISDAKGLSLLFVTDGQLVPKDIHLVSSAFVLGMLKGFAIDFSSLWQTQIAD